MICFAIVACLFLFTGPASSQSYISNDTFLATAVNVAKDTTVTNGTNFSSGAVRVSHPGYGAICAITVTFTRAAGSTSTLDFEFQCSYDSGTTYSTSYYVRLRPATNETAVSNVVRYTSLVYIYGISHLKLYRIVNNDATNAVTACNATVSFSVAAN